MTTGSVYRVLMGYNKDTLCGEVTNHLNDGWHLHGSMAVQQLKNGPSERVFYQPVVRYSVQMPLNEYQKDMKRKQDQHMVLAEMVAAYVTEKYPKPRPKGWRGLQDPVMDLMKWSVSRTEQEMKEEE